jgi:hypothetical protein
VTVTIKGVSDSEIRQSTNPNWPSGDSTGFIYAPPIDIQIPDDGKLSLDPLFCLGEMNN